MAFAQFYYDPALEFERLLDEDCESTANAALVDVRVGAPGRAAGVAGATDRSKSTSEVTTGPAAVDGAPRPSQGEPSRWFGDGFMKRRATTGGSVNSGSHPCIPK
ncbi:hypothetical protein PYCCODRAFT_1432065 [Trametes coccinea BRFM310]|uniref:Uncharacterized protein n=1 Tax=Trametes coccinea (strain BRFM310) TaxID=1353009 RepID=A0A1Y2J218_TRAC3|nr:hypothetical protein PYCCODRAFT_1432065 [Trametes coccinea BRFM310]